MKWSIKLGWLALFSAMVFLESRWVEAAPRLSRRDDMVKELMKLDQFYSSIARPSVRSVGGDESMSPKIQRAINMLRLQNLDRLYADRSRPRFGKRTDPDSNFTPFDFDNQFQNDNGGADYPVVVRR